MFLDLFQAGFDVVHLFFRTIDIVERYAPDGNFQQCVNIVISHLAFDLPLKRSQSVKDGLHYALGCLHRLDLFVYAVLYEYLLQRFGVEFIF